jgi:2-oxoisovalerate dehydrogenase E1 component alpha subunit
MTYRFRPHTSDDDDRTYRSREEVEHAKANDPLIQFAAYMKETELLNDEAVERIEAEVKTEIERAQEEAWNAPDPEPASAFTNVFADPEGSPPS